MTFWWFICGASAVVAVMLLAAVALMLIAYRCVDESAQDQD